MAPPREFDEPFILVVKVRCFWSRGYRTTSVRDQAESMGITGVGDYNAFGDKRSPYRRSLDRYVSQSLGDHARRFEGNLSTLAALKAFFLGIIERPIADEERKGSALVNSELELAAKRMKCSTPRPPTGSSR
jgi:TetR/AcrR family transcriptional repressor of nem operon